MAVEVLATGIPAHPPRGGSFHGSARVHDWARCKKEPRERLFAAELVLAYEFGDPEPLFPRGFLSPAAAQRLRDEFAALIAETGLAAGRHARLNG